MNYPLFLYNFAITVLYTIAATFYIVWYARDGGKLYFWIAALFFSYILDNGLLFLRDQLALTTSIVAFASYTSLSRFIMFFCYAQVLSYLVGIKYVLLEKIVTIVLLTVSLYIDYIELYFPQLSFYVIFRGLISLMVLYLPLRGLFFVLSREKKGKLKRNGKLNAFFVLAVIIAVAFNIEFIVGLSGFRIIPGRMFFSELLGFYYCLVALLYAVNHIKNEVDESDGSVDLSQKTLMEQFREAYGLTSRETEICLLVAQGLTNHQISESAFISVGTVKVHTHNIYQKLGISKRSQILDMLSSFKLSLNA